MHHFLLSNFNYQFDSRLCNENSVFFALPGTQDSFSFIPNALSQGAKVIVSSKKYATIPQFDPSEPQKFPCNIIVPDVLAFMQDLAQKKFLTLKQNTTTISVTGSVGKTTMKEFLATNLQQYGTVHKTSGNYNNHIGLPFTVLNCPLESKFLVLEMGMNHTNEISFLCNIAPCQYTTITNCEDAHSENFPDGRNGVLKAKFEILSHPSKCFIEKSLLQRFQQNPYLTAKYPSATFFTTSSPTDIFHRQNSTHFIFQERNFTLNGIFSESQINMLCVGINMIDHITHSKIQTISMNEIKGRGNVITWQGIKIIDQSYNASPQSMYNSLENFTKISGKKLAILGQMKELSDPNTQHQKLVNFTQTLDIQTIFIGSNFGNNAHFPGYPSLLSHLKTQNLTNFDAILIKASNGTMLWKLFDEFFI